LTKKQLAERHLVNHSKIENQLLNKHSGCLMSVDQMFVSQLSLCRTSASKMPASKCLTAK